MSQEDTLEQLAATFNGHQITDEEGNLAESETATEESAPEEQTTEEDSIDESETEDTQSEDTEEPVEDESGKRYVPEKRFKKVYAKLKEYERQQQEQDQIKQEIPSERESIDYTKADPNTVLEQEVLLDRYPQFDSQSEYYSPELDRIGGLIAKANPGISRIAAAKEALRIYGGTQNKKAQVKAEVRNVKSQQTDQGLTTRSISRGEAQKSPDNMSLEEMEDYMKKNGMW